MFLLASTALACHAALSCLVPSRRRASFSALASSKSLFMSLIMSFVVRSPNCRMKASDSADICDGPTIVKIAVKEY
jgi:hypothetical protein